MHVYLYCRIDDVRSFNGCTRVDSEDCRFLLRENSIVLF